MSSDCSDDEGSPGGGGGGHMPVVYPWMKKIHVSGQGMQRASAFSASFKGQSAIFWL